jgi:hypothetical protein
MTNRSHEEFHDTIITPDEVEGLPERFFDRFVFNLHPTGGSRPSIIVGLGLHPVRNTVDGFVQLCTETEQRNARYSTQLSATSWDTCGPFAYEVIEPNTKWRLQLGDNPTGMSFDLTWTARTSAWWGDIQVTNSSGEETSFAHLFQSGHVDGTLTIDGEVQRVEQWYSQRDRSRGVRTMAGGQGLHIWYQAQFADRSVGFLLVESRDGGRLLLEGAVMKTDGTLDEIVDVKHDLRFDDQLDLKSGLVQITTASGAILSIDTDATGGGGLMAGAGYGGHHGESLGVDHVEGEIWPLDGSITQRTVDSSLTDRLASFTWDGKEGSGIFEFALTRSSSYTYKPTLG